MDIEDDPYEWGLLNMDFHKTIYEALHAPLLTYATAHQASAKAAPRDPPAVTEGNGKRAESLVRQQITYSRQVYTKDLFDGNSDSPEPAADTAGSSVPT